jgi:hypothetical protein
MWTRTATLAVTTALGWLFVSHCGSSSSACTGAEACACYGNGSCDDGLACRSNVCVDLNSTGAGGGSGSGGLDVQACLSCAEGQCPSQAMACKAVSDCNDIITCLVGCNKDATCLSKCNANASADANTKSLAYQTCAFTSCTSQCTVSGGSTTGAGGSSSTGSGASSMGAGGSGATVSSTCSICDKAHTCCLAVVASLGMMPSDCSYYDGATCTKSGNSMQYAYDCQRLVTTSAMDFPACK